MGAEEALVDPVVLDLPGAEEAGELKPNQELIEDQDDRSDF